MPENRVRRFIRDVAAEIPAAWRGCCLSALIVAAWFAPYIGEALRITAYGVGR